MTTISTIELHIAKNLRVYFPYCSSPCLKFQLLNFDLNICIAGTDILSLVVILGTTNFKKTAVGPAILVDHSGMPHHRIAIFLDAIAPFVWRTPWTNEPS